MCALRLEAGRIGHYGHERCERREHVEPDLIPSPAVADDRPLDVEPASDPPAVTSGGDHGLRLVRGHFIAARTLCISDHVDDHDGSVGRCRRVLDGVPRYELSSGLPKLISLQPARGRPHTLHVAR